MNYYIQGDAANADKIKAAFKEKGYRDQGWIFSSKHDLYFSVGTLVYAIPYKIRHIVTERPDYKELKLLVEPKFEVGDWIVQNDNGTVSQITKEINGFDEYGEYHAYEHTNGYFHACFEDEFHLWTIADAKDGDVLAAHEVIAIFKEIDGLNIRNHVAFHYMNNPSIHTNCLNNKKAFTPATQEQRDKLFRKLKEEGYKWDAEKKELKKIQPHYDIKNFKPFDKVLVRDRNNESWRIAFYGYYNEEANYSHFVGTCWSKQCIPYNDDTKHLLGTTDIPSEEYINW